MTVKYNSPGVSAKELGTIALPNERPRQFAALVIGTSPKGPAFVPSFFSKNTDFQNKFGEPYVSGSKISSYHRLTDYAPFAMTEWFSFQQSAYFIRVLGTGDGNSRVSIGTNAGDVVNAGFTVGEEQPNHDSLSGSLGSNPYANSGGVLGRTYFLGCFMSESAGSNFFNSAGIQGTGSINGIGINTSVPLVRGILMAPSGVILRLSSSAAGYDSSAPSSTQIANDFTSKGTTVGAIKLFHETTGQPLQQFILLLNGHKGSDEYPNALTASLDMQSPLYISRVLNTTASLIQQAGHYLAAHWDIHPSVATLTGVGVVSSGAGVESNSSRVFSTERSIFLLTSSLSRDVGSSAVPNYEGFRDRFSHASTPWIISQKIHGKHINLFKLHSLHDGEQTENHKIIIHDITSKKNKDDSGFSFGNFSLSIRNLYDFDETSPPLESFVDLSLNPSSDRYISKVIGDSYSYFDFDRPKNNQKIVVEGNYRNNSKYVRVEVSNEVQNSEIPHSVLPFGFRGIPHIVTSGSSVMASLAGQDASALINSSFLRNLIVPPLPFVDNIIVYNGDKQNASQTRRWGIKVDHPTDLLKQNNFQHKNESILNFSKYFPSHSTSNINFLVSNNHGTPDTTQLGVLDADRFCNNLFTLENISILTSSTGYASKEDWISARYIRNGDIQTIEDLKTRRVDIKDFQDATSRNFLSFQTILCGGFNGVNIFDLNESNLTNAAIVADSYDVNRGKAQAGTTAAYLKALDIIKNTTDIDIHLLAIPGIRSPIVTDEAADVAENRMDTLYLMDIEQLDNDYEQIHMSEVLAYSNKKIPDLQKTIDNFSDRLLRNSFSAAYYPDVILKLDAAKYGIDSLIVPPSVAVLGAFSINDTLGRPWLSPSGNTRGATTNVISTVARLKKEDADALYSKSINYLYAPTNVGGQQTGVIIGGQKTLSSSSLLSRISVRRLLIYIRQKIRSIALKLVFEQRREVIIDTFTSEATEFLTEIRGANGLSEYKIEISASQTTQNDIDNQTIRGKIYIKPPKAIDYLSLDFIVSNNLQSEI